MARAPVHLPPDPARSLRDRLFALGVEFPCGGLAQCGACRVRVLEGQLPITAPMRDVLDDAELAAGWRLACHAETAGALTLEIEQWTSVILGDEAEVPVEPRPGYGLVIDIGTTTIVAQRVDLATGDVLQVESALNAQAAYGADVMSRIAYDLAHPGALREVIRDQLDEMMRRLCPEGRPVEILLAGNTVMHHLWAGLPVAPLAEAPFRTPHLDSARGGWRGAPITFLPNAGGFAGSDLLMGLIATGMLDDDQPAALLDLGTNGEIAVGGRHGIRVASTAAGPAFEGGRIRQGMRAGAGAIDRVWREGRSLHVRVIGGVEARGICGSGLVDAVSAGLDAGYVTPAGRLETGLPHLRLTDTVAITQRDIRELQLAKGAVAAGFSLLSEGVKLDDVFLAGAFGNYVRAESAQRIGLLPRGIPEPVASGNTSLRGLRMLLLTPGRRAERLYQITSAVEHVELAADPDFQERFLDGMSFG